MIRVLVIALLVAGIGAGGYLAVTSGEEPPRYRIVVDNAFGLTEGADLKAAGVRVGQIASFDVKRGSNDAIVTVEVEDTSFGDFRKDVFCSTKPQSLIGEYFIDCDPGTSKDRVREGATIPVEQTASTIPPDLVNNVMRRPYRERLGIILAELGAGFAANGPELQETIKRAVPALRETDRVLKILADNRRTLESLTREADTVLFALSENRGDVARFVSEARDTAAASAERRGDLATNIRLLPTFLRRLRPVLRDLGTAADRQTPALRDLRLAADDLELLLGRLGPFARASVPAVVSLGKASETGRQAMRTAGKTVAELRELAEIGEDPVSNLRFILEHLDNRRFAVEPNRESPTGKGFTGLEALLRYFYVQPQAINTFDARGYLLKLNILPSPCSKYANAETVRNDPALRRQCSASLGPGPEFGIDEGPSANASSARSTTAKNRGARTSSARDGRAGASTRAAGRPDVADRGGLMDAAADQLDRLTRVAGGAAPGPRPAAPRISAPSQTQPTQRPSAEAQAGLLDYLLAP